MDLYIDAEWYINQKIFLIGYCFADHRFHKPIRSGQLYGKAISKKNVRKLLKQVNSDCIFFYGPDIGMLEKQFDLNIRGNYLCVNLLKVFKDLYPNETRYKLSDFEMKFGYRRDTIKYKKSIFEVFDDWKDPEKRQIVLRYNEEDVISLAKIKKRVWKRHRITGNYLNQIRLQ